MRDAEYLISRAGSKGLIEKIVFQRETPASEGDFEETLLSVSMDVKAA